MGRTRSCRRPWRCPASLPGPFICGSAGADGTLLQAGDALCHPGLGASYELPAKVPEAFSNGAFATAMMATVGDGGAGDR